MFLSLGIAGEYRTGWLSEAISDFGFQISD